MWRLYDQDIETSTLRQPHEKRDGTVVLRDETARTRRAPTLEPIISDLVLTTLETRLVISGLNV